MFEEFKNFAFKGNAFDLAIGVIMGGAFGKIVDSMVSDLIMPIIGLLTGGIDFSQKFAQLSGAPAATLAAAKEAGADYMLKKPFDLTELQKSIAKALLPKVI